MELKGPIMSLRKQNQSLVIADIRTRKIHTRIPCTNENLDGIIFYGYLVDGTFKCIDTNEIHKNLYLRILHKKQNIDQY